MGKALESLFSWETNGMFDSTGCTAAIARETSFEEMQVLKIPSKMYYSSSHVVLLRAVGRSESSVVGGQVVKKMSFEGTCLPCN